MTLHCPTGFSVYFIAARSNDWDAWPQSKGDFTLDEQAAHILKGDPKAYIFVRYSLRPPESWKRKHQDQYFIGEDGHTGRVPSLASDEFFRDASRHSAAIVRYCESRPWASRVIGYANFGVLEGTHYPAAEGWIYDHNPLMLKRWRGFLTKKYGAGYENAAIPMDKMRGPALARVTHHHASRADTVTILCPAPSVVVICPNAELVGAVFGAPNTG
jgi:hypothetical protein